MSYTNIIFVRHCQSLHPYSDDRTRPLTEEGLKDREVVVETLKDRRIDVVFSSPYKRSVDTVQPVADLFDLPVRMEERFHERVYGVNSREFRIKRWEDLSLAEENGESLKSVQDRNMEALKEVLVEYRGKTVVIGTHGTALSTILHYYDNSFNAYDFYRIVNWTPYVVELVFDGDKLLEKKELAHVEKTYQEVDFSTITACGESCVKCAKKLDGRCPGCNEAEGVVPEWKESGRCKVYACVHDHGAKFCGLCPEFPCEKAPKLMHWKENVIRHMAYLRDEYYIQMSKDGK